MGKIGEIMKVFWYELETGEIVTFHTALSYNDDRVTLKRTFVADRETWPSLVAGSLGIRYHLLRIATDMEREEFMMANKFIKIKKVIEI